MGLTDDLTVTVVATHGLAADGLDTAISVLGVERGLALIESRPDAAALIVQTDAGRHQARALVSLSGTRGFPAGSEDPAATVMTPGSEDAATVDSRVEDRSHGDDSRV